MLRSGLGHRHHPRTTLIFVGADTANDRKADRRYQDILYEIDGDAAVTTINREKLLNAFRAKTIEELVHAFKGAWTDPSRAASSSPVPAIAPSPWEGT